MSGGYTINPVVMAHLGRRVVNMMAMHVLDILLEELLVICKGLK